MNRPAGGVNDRNAERYWLLTTDYWLLKIESCGFPFRRQTKPSST